MKRGLGFLAILLINVAALAQVGDSRPGAGAGIGAGKFGSAAPLGIVGGANGLPGLGIPNSIFRIQQPTPKLASADILSRELCLRAPFWDRENQVLFVSGAAERGLDVWTTTHLVDTYHGTEDLLPHAMARSVGWMALDAVVEDAATTGLAWWMHRAGHGRISRGLMIANVVLTGAAQVNNLAWMAVDASGRPASGAGPVQPPVGTPPARH